MLDRSLFPIAREWTYLDHATFGPLPSSTASAVASISRDLSEGVLGQSVRTGELLASVRQRAAQLLSCTPQHIALLHSTGEGLNLVSAGLTWQPGDEVVAYARDFPGALAPWQHLVDRGVQLRLIADRPDHAFSCADVESLMTPRTRVVCLSLVQYGSGFRAPIEEIGEVCRQRGVWLVVDAAQAMGALCIDAGALGADIIAAHGYKFLLSGFGLGICYSSDRAIAELRVSQVGWKGGEGAARFEPSIPSLLNLAAMNASLELLQTCGVVELEAHVLEVADAIARGMRARGWNVASAEGQQRSALVSATHSELDLETVRASLLEQHVAVGVRDGFLRVSPHFYSSAEDADRFLTALPT